MGQVHTVRGPVDAAALGTTLMHEHVFIRSPELEMNWPTGWDATEAVPRAVDRLTELAEAGIGTIVDLTVPGLGRDLSPLQEVAEQVPLNIVVATGYYTYDKLPHYFDGRVAGLRSSGVDALDEFFLHDVEEDIAGSGVRAGMLKCAVDEPGLTPDVERVLRAVARVHRRTGVPVTVHTHAPTRRGLEVQGLLSEEGVDLSRVVIGHSGDSTDIEYLTALTDAGSIIGMDRFGVDVYCSTADRVETVAKLCELGRAGQMVLSHDASCHFDWYEPELVAGAGPNWHYLHISRDVLPALRRRGVSEEDVRTMLVDVPRRILDHGSGY
ncbi:MAG TPA: phosphotriesterase-related protein [Acidimicrobiaceae bacterium]|nr:phosphotriesterase-related protein [Acidimicrobiaceae bacterium]